MSLTKDDIKKHIEIELGGSDVTIDLTQADHDHIVTDALRVLGTNKPVEKVGVLHVSSGVQKYQLDDNTWGRSVIRVMRPIPSSPIYNAWPFPDPYILSVPVHFLGDYVLGYTHQKEAEYLFGSDFGFDFDRTTGILLLKPAPIAGGNYTYIYLDNPNLADVKGREQWLLDYCVATAKMIQANKWRKFKGFPGNENQVELAVEQYDEGKEEKDRLIEQVQRAGAAMVPPMPAYKQG